MTKKELFTCDICHTDYNSEDEALNCETSHIDIDEISDKVYNIRQKYPDKIEISFADGKAHWYKIDK